MCVPLPPHQHRQAGSNNDEEWANGVKDEQVKSWLRDLLLSGDNNDNEAADRTRGALNNLLRLSAHDVSGHIISHLYRTGLEEGQEEQEGRNQKKRKKKLRFGVGTEVLCLVESGKWKPGKVSKLWLHKDLPYLCELNDGSIVAAPYDSNNCIKLKSESSGAGSTAAAEDDQEDEDRSMKPGSALIHVVQQENLDVSLRVDALKILINWSVCCVPTSGMCWLCQQVVQDGAIEAAIELLGGNDFVATELVEHALQLLSNVLSFAQAKVQWVSPIMGALCRFADTLSLQTNAILSLLAMCECHQKEKIGETTSKKIVQEGGIPVVVASMRWYSNDPTLQTAAIELLKHVSFAKATIGAIQEAHGIEAVLEAMETHPNSPNIQGCGSGFFRSIACDRTMEETIGESNAIPAVLNGMRLFPEHPVVQQLSCAALWNISSFQSTQVPMADLGAIELVIAAMENHPDSTGVLEHAMGALWNLASAYESLRIKIAQTNAINLVAKGIKAHGAQHPKVGKEGAGALMFLTRTNDDSVKRALVDSDAISALRFIRSKQNMFDPDFGFHSPSFCIFEFVDEALKNLGVDEVNVIGDDDDEYDGDNEEDGPIESPPFDIDVILDRDLSANTSPGWYRSCPFHLDREQSHELEEKWGATFLFLRLLQGYNDYKSDNFLRFLEGTAAVQRNQSPLRALQGSDTLRVIRSFLRPKELPTVGQQVCIRVMLPFGGRGYLYGEVTEVGPLPTDEQLRNSDSVVFEVGCPCPDPECPIGPNGTRNDLLGAYGSLYGQEVKATVSLDPGRPLEEKLRNAPLAAFFRGKQTEYNVTLRFLESADWQVVHLTKST